MRKDIIKDLVKARELSRAGKYLDSIEIFRKHFDENPEEFRQVHRDEYALAVYNAHVKNSTSERELLDASEFITELSAQKDTTGNGYCIYTITVFRVLRHLNSNKLYHMFPHWLDKIDPNLLSDFRFQKNGRVYSSNIESYYEYLSMAHFYHQEYEKCIEVSIEALDAIDVFTNDGDAWILWRVAKSLKELNRLDEALDCLDRALEIRHDEYMYRLGAEIQCMLNNPFKALDYLCPVILSDEPSKAKINAFHMAYDILKDFNPEMALPHAQLYYMLKLEEDSYVESEIWDLCIDDNGLDKRELLGWVRDVWTRFKFRYQKLQHGTVSSYESDKGYGFITDANDKSVFFHKNDIDGDGVFVGQSVSFYIEENFDKAKNQNSVNIINVMGE